MQNSDNSSLIKFLGIESGSTLHGLIESSLEVVPIIGKIHNSYKMMRLQKRVTENEKRLTALSITMYENENKLLNEFIRERAFPIVLDELLGEHEEEKIDLVINGLEYMYNESITELSKILVYFDVLRELRVEELKKLITFSDHYQRYWRPKLDLNLFSREDREGRKKYRENQGYKAYIDNHLETLGLTTKKDIASEYKETISHELILTEFGKNFIEFFELKVLVQIPAE